MQLKNSGQRHFGSHITPERQEDKRYFGCRSSADLERSKPAPKTVVQIKQKKEIQKC